MDCCGGVVLGIEGGFSPYRWMTSSSDGSPLQCAAHRSRTAADPAASSRPSRGTRTYPATHPALASAHTNVVSGGNDAIDTTSSSAPAHAAGPQHGHQHRSSPPPAMPPRADASIGGRTNTSPCGLPRWWLLSFPTPASSGRRSDEECADEGVLGDGREGREDVAWGVGERQGGVA